MIYQLKLTGGIDVCSVMKRPLKTGSGKYDVDCESLLST